LSAEHGSILHEGKLLAGDLARASECFVTSATREVMPVASLRLESGACAICRRAAVK